MNILLIKRLVHKMHEREGDDHLDETRIFNLLNS